MNTPVIRLHDGRDIPQVGFGVFQIAPDETQAAVESALEAGYRHIDTAAAYVNERAVGAAIAASGIPREEIWITTKLRNGDQGGESAVDAAHASLDRLGIAAFDLYLIHWPSPARGLYVKSWGALETLHAEGLARSIGVSNFMPDHLDDILEHGDVRPVVNQIEVHPTFQQRALAAACAERGIVVEAYSPLGQAADLDLLPVRQIARAHDVTPAQVVLRWHVDRGRVVIPKTQSPDRMRANLDLEGVALSAEELDAIDACEAGARIGGDPYTFEISQIR